MGKMYNTDFTGYPYEYTRDALQDTNKLDVLMRDEINKLLDAGYDMLEVESMVFESVYDAILMTKLNLRDKYSKEYKERK